MKEPLRFRDDDGAPSELRALLRGADRSRRLPPQVRARSVARLDRLLALPAASGLVLWLKGLAIAAAVGGAGVVVVTQTVTIFGDAPPPAASASAPAPSGAPRLRPSEGKSAPSTSATAPPPQPALSSPAPRSTPSAPPIQSPIAPSLRPHAAEVAPLPVATNAADALTAQASVLERARAWLDRDPGAALAQIDALAVAYPDGALRTEREFLAVDALSRLHRTDAARARGEAFLREGHGSLYDDRVRAILERLPAH